MDTENPGLWWQLLKLCVRTHQTYTNIFMLCIGLNSCDSQEAPFMAGTCFSLFCSLLVLKAALHCFSFHSHTHTDGRAADLTYWGLSVLPKDTSTDDERGQKSNRWTYHLQAPPLPPEHQLLRLLSETWFQTKIISFNIVLLKNPQCEESHVWSFNDHIYIQTYLRSLAWSDLF